MITHSAIHLPSRTPISLTKRTHHTEAINDLSHASNDTTYQIKEIQTTDQELKDFLLTLGCYQGESVTVVSILSESYVIIIKDARYNIDHELAKAIKIE